MPNYFNNRFFIPGVLILAFIISFIIAGFSGVLIEHVADFGKPEIKPQPAAILRLSDALDAELNGIFTPEFDFSFDDAGNPFRDNTGVSLAAASKAQPAPLQTANRNPVGSNMAFAPSVARRQNLPLEAQNSPNLVSLPAMPSTSVSDIKEQLQQRARQAKLGQEVADLSTYYTVEDVRPYGYVGTKENNRVKLYALSTKQNFSVGRGARFRDGATIVSFNDEGAQFRLMSGEIVTRRWLTQREKQPVGENPAAPILRVDSNKTTENSLKSPSLGLNKENQK